MVITYKRGREIIKNSKEEISKEEIIRIFQFLYDKKKITKAEYDSAIHKEMTSV